MAVNNPANAAQFDDEFKDKETTEQYGQMLDRYLTDIKTQELIDADEKKS